MATRTGTCSWKFESWRGLVYPAEGAFNYLREYAAHYSTVEIDQWFWSLFGVDKVKLPDAATVEEYAGSVPEDFKFSIKIPNSITLSHFYTHGKPRGAPLQTNPHFLSGQLFGDFIDRLGPLGDRIGVLMFQFEYLNKQKMASQGEFLDRFGAFIETCSRRYPLAVEIRNPNYLNRRYFEFLNRHGMFHVFVQGYYMPPITRVYRDFGDFIRRLAVIRLMGTDRKGIERRAGNRWDAMVDPRDDELPEILSMIRSLEKKNTEIYLNVNNHYEGCAPLTIKKMSEMLKDVV